MTSRKSKVPYSKSPQYEKERFFFYIVMVTLLKGEIYESHLFFSLLNLIITLQILLSVATCSDSCHSLILEAFFEVISIYALESKIKNP